MTTIVDKDSHIVGVDANTHRLYCIMTGQGELPDTAALIQELSVTMGLVRRGCTVLLDVSQIHVLTVEWIVRLSWIRKMLIETKQARIAEVFAVHLVGNIKTSECRKIFTRREDAEAWLDEMSHHHRHMDTHWNNPEYRQQERMYPPM